MSGTELKKGDTIKFIVADASVEYPDFVEEQWSIDQIDKFCKDNNITLTIKYYETIDSPEGMVIAQNREAGTKVAKYASLVITVTKEPEVAPLPEEVIPSNPEAPDESNGE